MVSCENQCCVCVFNSSVTMGVGVLDACDMIWYAKVTREKEVHHKKMRTKKLRSQIN